MTGYEVRKYGYTEPVMAECLSDDNEGQFGIHRLFACGGRGVWRFRGG